MPTNDPMIAENGSTMPTSKLPRSKERVTGVAGEEIVLGVVSVDKRDEFDWLFEK